MAVSVLCCEEATGSESARALAAARVEYVTHRDKAQASGGLAQMQAEVGAREARATEILCWQPAVVPGLLQTGEYARDVLQRMREIGFTSRDEAEIEATVAERVKRQDILYQPGRHVEVIVGEAALRAAPDAVDTLLGQLDRLVSLTALKTLRLGVIPFPAMPVIPLSGFEIRDGLAVEVETLTASHTLHEPAEVAAYVTAFELLRDAAVSGPDAVALIRRVMTDLGH